MSNRKSPVFLRVVIILVAMLLGLSLNMFQFRDPFRNIAGEQMPPLSPAEKAARDKAARGGLESASPVAPEKTQADHPASTSSASSTSGRGQSSESMTLPEHTPIVIPGKSTGASPSTPSGGLAGALPGGKARTSEPAQTAASSPESDGPHKEQAEASSGKAASPATSHESSGLALPKVTSDSAVARAGGVGRMVPAQAGSELAEADKEIKEESALPGQSGTEGKNGQAAPMPAPPSRESAAGPEATSPKSSLSGQSGEQMKASAAQATASETGNPPQTAGSAGPGQAGAQPPVQAASGEAALPTPPAPAGSAQSPQAPPAPSVPPIGPTQTEQGAASQTPQTIEAAEAKAPEQKGGKVLEITTQDLPGEFVVTIKTDGPVERVTSFHAKSPARLVVDLWGGWQPGGPLIMPLQSGIMEKVRQGVHPEKLRLVLDYRDKDLGEFSEPVIEKQPKAVVVKVPKAR